MTTSAQHTPSEGTLTVAALHRLVKAAAARANTAMDIGAVKHARELVRDYEAGESNYQSVARAVVELRKIVEPAPRPFVNGVVFVESSTTQGTFYRVMGASCTCLAGSHGRPCKHIEAASKGDGWRATFPKATNGDAFAKVNR